MSASTLSDSFVFARRNLEHIRQIPEKLTEVTIQPLMFTLLFAYVFGGAITVKGGGYREYLIGGILIQSLAFAMMGPATAIATDLQGAAGERSRCRLAPTHQRVALHRGDRALGRILLLDDLARVVARHPGSLARRRDGHRIRDRVSNHVPLQRVRAVEHAPRAPAVGCLGQPRPRAGGGGSNIVR